MRLQEAKYAIGKSRGGYKQGSSGDYTLLLPFHGLNQCLEIEKKGKNAKISPPYPQVL
ncbi:MAG: hypothetical protein MR992_07170 [Lachnospiraceae bacterium]|nr:hypothetical protein [Lachnospiraceae bacterium]MDY4120312.1 hypothetical protein [Lachnospiraceae bacterium]